MSDIPVKNVGSSINANNAAGSRNTIQQNPQTSFEDVISEALGKVSQVQNDVDKAVSELEKGGDITSAVLAVEKADMSFQLMVEVRNKLISTYEEIMRLQV